MKKIILLILLFLIFILISFYVKAEEPTISISMAPNIPGKAILTYLSASNLYQDFGEVNFGTYTLTLKRELTEEEINKLANGLPQYRRQLRGILNTLNTLFYEKYWKGIRIIEDLQVNEYGKITGGSIHFRDSNIGDIIAKSDPEDIQIYNALINFSENNIFLYREGFFKIFDSKTQIMYYYSVEEWNNEIIISYKYDNLREFSFNLGSSKIKISCVSYSEKIDRFCLYKQIILNQSPGFVLKIRSFTKVSGPFYYTKREKDFISDKWTEHDPELKIAGRRLPFNLGFSYDTYFDLRTEKFIFFLFGQVEKEDYEICYGKIDDILYYNPDPRCYLKIMPEGKKEFGVSTEIYTDNVAILHPKSEEELEKIIEILRG